MYPRILPLVLSVEKHQSVKSRQTNKFHAVFSLQDRSRIMGIWSGVKQVLGATQRRTADRGPMPPIFERLEERILLSADPLGLRVGDPFEDDGITESAIVIDFDLADPAIGEGSGANGGESTADSPGQLTQRPMPTGYL